MYDFSVRPDSSSSPGALKAFWNQVRLYATDQQKHNLGPAPQQFAESQHTQSQEYKSPSFAEFLRAEDARLAPERERQRLAAIATSDRVLAAKQRKIEREAERQQAKAGQAFRDFWANYVQSDTICQFHYDFAFARGHIRDSSPHHYEIYEGYSAALNRANRELNDPALHALYDPSGQSWRQRAEIIRKATEKKQAVAQAGHEN